MQKATSLVSSGKKCLVIGATGGVGRLIVRVLALDPRVSHITAIVRSERPRAFFFEGMVGTSEAEAKIEQLKVADFDKLQDHESTFKAGKFDSFLSGLGLYTADVKSEDEFEKVEIHYNEVVAKAVVAGGTKAAAYLSGNGVVKPEAIGALTPMFARVKGKAEATFERLFPTGMSARPGGILDRPGPQKFWDGVMNSWAFRWMGNTSLGIEAILIAKAMVQGGLIEPLQPNQSVENNDLKHLAHKYDTGLAATTREAPPTMEAAATGKERKEKKDQL